MKTICIVADTHRNHRQVVIPSCDLLIHCGDFCRFQREDAATLEDADAWFAEVPAAEVVCIAGNHDFLLQSRAFRFHHATFLQDAGCQAAGLQIYGTPWCPELEGFAYYAPQEELIQRWRAIPAGIDVLVTHTPPFGILDTPTAGSPHLGCPHLRQELRRIQPRVHVFGHIHASYGRAREDGIEFANAAVAWGRDLEPRNPATVIRL